MPDEATQTLDPAAQPASDAGTTSAGADIAPEVSVETKAEPVVEAKAKTPEEIEAASRAAYERAKVIAAGGEDPGEAKPEAKAAAKDEPKDEARDEQGRFKPKPESAPSLDTAATPEAREKYVVALRAMRRDGMSQEKAEKFLSDAENMAFAEERAKFQAKEEKRFSELRTQAERSGKAIPPSAKDGTDDAPANGAVDDGPVGTKAAANADDELIPASVRDTLTDDEAKALRASVERRIKAATQAATDRLSKADTALNDAFEERCVLVQRELSESFPALKAEEPPAEFRAALQRLAKSPGYNLGTTAGLKELFTDAALIVYGKALQAQARQSSIDTNRRALAGRPTLGSPGSEAPARTLSAEERSKIAYEAAKSASSPADANKKFTERIGAAAKR